MSDKTENPLLYGLMKELKHNPQEAIESCKSHFQESRLRHHETVHQVLSFIVAYVLELRASPENTKAFLEKGFWGDKPQKPQASRLPRLVTMFVVGAKSSSSPRYGQSTKYTKVVKHFLNEGTDPQDIPAKFRGKSMRTIVARVEAADEYGGKAATLSQKSRAKARQGDGVSTGNGTDDPDGSDANNDDDNATVPSSATRTDEGQAVGVKPATNRRGVRPPVNMKKHLILKADNYLECILSLELKGMEWVKIQRVADMGEFKQYRVVKFGRRRRAR